MFLVGVLLPALVFFPLELAGVVVFVPTIVGEFSALEFWLSDEFELLLPVVLAAAVVELVFVGTVLVVELVLESAVGELVFVGTALVVEVVLESAVEGVLLFGVDFFVDVSGVVGVEVLLLGALDTAGVVVEFDWLCKGAAFVEGV